MAQRIHNDFTLSCCSRSHGCGIVVVPASYFTAKRGAFYSPCRGYRRMQHSYRLFAPSTFRTQGADQESIALFADGDCLYRPVGALHRLCPISKTGPRPSARAGAHPGACAGAYTYRHHCRCLYHRTVLFICSTMNTDRPFSDTKQWNQSSRFRGTTAHRKRGAPYGAPSLLCRSGPVPRRSCARPLRRREKWGMLWL